jgi:hypothetical protein
MMEASMRVLSVVLIISALTIPVRAGATEVQQNFQIQAAACEARFHSGNPDTAIQRAQCINNALSGLLRYEKDADLLRYFIAQRMVIIERFAKRKLTHVETNAELARLASQLVTEMQRREALRQTVEAQRRAAAAQEQAARAQSQAADAADDVARAVQFGTVLSIMRGFSR